MTLLCWHYIEVELANLYETLPLSLRRDEDSYTRFQNVRPQAAHRSA